MSLGICPYCKEPAGRNELGYTRAIHPEHQAGTPYWAKWYRRERDAGRHQSEVGDFLLAVAEVKMIGAGAGLAKMQAMNRERVSTQPPSKKGLNPGLLRMQELNRLRREEKAKKDV